MKKHKWGYSFFAIRGSECGIESFNEKIMKRNWKDVDCKRCLKCKKNIN
jgi:hypothetical protein